MVSDKISVKRSNIKNDVKVDPLKKAQFLKQQADDDGDEGGGGAGKKKGHSYKGEQLQKLVGKGTLKAGPFKGFLSRHEGVDVSDLKETVLKQDAKEAEHSELTTDETEAKSQHGEDYLKDSHRDLDSNTWQRLPADNNKTNRGFFGKEVSQPQTLNQGPYGEIATQAYAKAVSGSSDNFQGFASQSWIGNIADTPVKSAQAKRGSFVGGSIYAEGPKTNHLGEVVLNVKAAPYKSFLESTAAGNNKSQSNSTRGASTKATGGISTKATSSDAPGATMIKGKR